MMRTSTLPTAVLRRGLLASAAVTTSLILSACGGSSPSSSGMGHAGMSTSSTPTSTATFNSADVHFAQSMIPHHEQAVQMAALAEDRAAGSEVKALAVKIKAAQQPEIDTMAGWLTAWGSPMPMAGMSAGTGMADNSMPGMMSGSDLAELSNTTGVPFDKQFLTMMISHHQGAIEMAKQEIAQGSNPDAKALAQKIITDQQAEIITMKAILTHL